jgi:hypothetical protein
MDESRCCCLVFIAWFTRWAERVRRDKEISMGWECIHTCEGKLGRKRKRILRFLCFEDRL